MSNDKDGTDRLSKLQAEINMMVADGTRKAEDVADTLQQILEEKQRYLRHLETVSLAPTKGKATLAKAKKVFTAYIDGNFKHWGTDVRGEDTDETKVDVRQMLYDGKYRTLFGSLGDPRKLCLTQGQIEEFCRSHRDSLRGGGYPTSFLFEVKGQLLVTNVYKNNLTLAARIHRFSDNTVWSADDCYRLVTQQQTVRFSEL